MKDFFRHLRENTLPPKYRMPALFMEYTPSLLPPPDRGEALRYAGIPGPGQGKNPVRARDPVGPEGAGRKNAVLGEETSIVWDQLVSLYEETLRLTEGQLTFRISYLCAALSWEMREGELFPILPFKQQSLSLKRNLESCRGVVLFAATIGAGIDRLIRRYERIEPARGVLLQGIGAERVEALCQRFFEEVKEKAHGEGLAVHHRFSPGYGDLPLDVQPEVLSLLDAQRRLGITLNASWLMSPSKSVTALIGIE